MKKIDISTEKYPNKFALVDNEDFEWLSKWKWNFNNGTGYAQRNVYLGKVDNKYLYKHEYMHRLILKTPKNFDTDHINNFKLDNQKKNLRIATRRQNLQNRFNSKRKNSNLPMGVGKHKDKWRARITVNGKEIHLGTYDTSKEAGIVYNRANEKYFGKFANPNNILDWHEIYPIRRKRYIDKGKKNSSGIVGVSFHKKNNKWEARITFNGKRIYLGLYANKLDAARVYSEAVKKYFGESVNLNKI